MFVQLVQKELMAYLLDFRFILVFALCAFLSALGIYVGSQNYKRQTREYHAMVKTHRERLQIYIDEGDVFRLRKFGYHWNRRPEILSPVVFGLSGKLGQEIQLHIDRTPRFEASLFEADPIYALFGILDLAFIVKFVLSLCVLLFTYDAVCGEKAEGTLRLQASFPTRRSTFALAKLVGTSIAVFVPLVFAFLLAAVVLALTPEMNLQVEDWLRLAAVTGGFACYLTVFVAFGLLGSALAHRPMSAFLGLMALWTGWIFLVPDMTIYIARTVVPVAHSAEARRQADVLFWEIDAARQADRQAYRERNPVENFDALSELQRERRAEDFKQIDDKWDGQLFTRLGQIQAIRRNQIRQQHRLAAALSTISPFNAVTLVSMDLARTSFIQLEGLEDAVLTYDGLVKSQNRVQIDDHQPRKSLCHSGSI